MNGMHSRMPGLSSPPHPAYCAAGAGEDTRLPDGCMDLVSIMLVRRLQLRLPSPVLSIRCCCSNAAALQAH